MTVEVGGNALRVPLLTVRWSGPSALPRYEVVGRQEKDPSAFDGSEWQQPAGKSPLMLSL